MKLLLSALLVSALTWQSTNAMSREKKGPDPCRYFSGTVIAILVDISEPLDVPQKMVYEKLSSQIIEQTPPNARLDLYKISDSSRGTESSVFSSCKPGPDPNSLLKTTGEKFFEKQVQVNFSKPLSEQFERLGKSVTLGKESPILESLFTISLKSFVDQRSAKPLTGRVVIISDFMQHSSLLSFYASHPSYSVWKNSAAGRSWVREFKGVKVQSIVIPRSGSSALPTSGRDFFVDYFVDNFSGYTWDNLNKSLQ